MANLGLLAIVLLCFGGVAVLQALDCPVCDPTVCPPEPKKCLAGVVKDSCGCCDVCGNLEGDRCDRDEYKGQPLYGPCGDNLQCQGRADLNDKETACICTEQKMLCGSNGETYENLCQLMEDAAETEETITVEREGPCKGFPWIATAPDDAHVYESDNISLACEAMGNPVPGIVWSFVDEKEHVETILPGDNEQLSVQLRGGPEKYEVTSWLLIQNARKRDQGNYRCIAKNELGQKDVHAAVKIYSAGQQIPAEGLVPAPKARRHNRNLAGQTRARRERRWQANTRHGEL